MTALSISLKGGNRKQYQELTGFDGFDRVVEGIREASKWKHIKVGVSTVMSVATLGNIVETANVAHTNGAPMMSFSVCGPSIVEGDFGNQYMPDPSLVAKVFAEKYDTLQRMTEGSFFVEMSIPTCLWPPELVRVMEERKQISYGCQFKSRSGVLFDRWGRVIPCNHLFDYPMGQYGADFTDRASFEALWERPALVNFYDKMLAYPAKACVSCKAFDKCGGGCPLGWFVREPETTIPTGGVSWTN